MKVKIENYGSIKRFEEDLFEKKIRNTNKAKMELLYGLSGTGKTTISNALQSVQKKSWIFNGDSAVSITNDETVIELNTVVFDDKKSLRLVKNDDNNMYEIISFGVEELELDQSVHRLIEIKQDILDKILLLKDDIQYKDNSKIIDTVYVQNGNHKFKGYKKQVDDFNEETNELYSDYLNTGVDYIQWVKQGNIFRTVDDEKCPYCLKNVIFDNVLDTERKFTGTKRDSVYKLTTSSMDHYNNEDWYNDEEAASNTIESDYNFFKMIENNEGKLRCNFEKKAMAGEVSELRLDSLNCQNFQSDELTELNVQITEYNNLIDEISNIKTVANAELNNIIRYNKSEVNELLKKLDVQYEVDFEVKHEQENAKYYLVPAHSTDQNFKLEDMSELSFGEKNLLSLVFMMFEKHKDKLIIFDDPISSFDEMKRSVIIREICNRYEQHYSENNCKVLILTHDEYFIKKVVFDSSIAPKFRTRLLQKTRELGIIRCVQIKEQNFITLNRTYLDSVRDKELYLKLLCLRQYWELNRKNSNDYQPEYKKLTNILKLKNSKFTEDELEELVNNEMFGNILPLDFKGDNKYISDDQQLTVGEIIDKYKNIDNLNFINELELIQKLMCIRFLVDDFYKYKEESFCYFLNDFIHLVTSPYKIMDFTSHNLHESFELRDDISNIIESRN